MRTLQGQDSHLPPAPHSQDSLLNWQRRVQPAVHMAAMGLIQPEDQRTALGTSLRLRKEVGDGWWAGTRTHPVWNPPLVAPCLLDCLQHNRRRGHREGAPGSSRCRAWGGQHQQWKIEAVGCADNASVLEGAWAGKEHVVEMRMGRQAVSPLTTGETEAQKRAAEGHGGTHPCAASARR